MSLTTSQFMIIISTAAFLAMFLLSVGILQYFRQLSKRREIVDKIKTTGESSGVLYSAGGSHDVHDGGMGSSIARFLRSLGNRIAPAKSSDYSKVRVKFLKAGIRLVNVSAMFWGAKLLLAVCLPLAFLVLRFTLIKLINTPLTLTLEVATAVLGYYLPDFLLTIRIEHRKEKLQKTLPDALDLLVVCVEAGMGMDAAMNRVAKEIQLSSPELSEELALLNLELRAGKSRQDALRNLAMRIDLDSINSLVTLLIQTDKFGTSVASALRVFSDGFRTQRFQKAEEIAAKMPVKLLIPLILFIFPSLFVVILGPAAIKIYQNLSLL
jgi:tight adherence protein C